MIAPVGDEALASFILQIGAFENRENAGTAAKLEQSRTYIW